jgi:hypothetical protein
MSECGLNVSEFKTISEAAYRHILFMLWGTKRVITRLHQLLHKLDKRKILF